jgi:hypothetical protein
MLENASKKRSKEKETIARYFTSTRNFDLVATTEKGSMPSETSLTTNSIGIDANALAAEAIDGLVTLSASIDATSIGGPSWVLTSSSDIQVIGGTAPPVTLSTDSSTHFLSEDDPNWHIFHDVPMTASGSYESEEEDIGLPPIPKRTRRNYEITRKFQIEWSTKAPWNEMILTHEGLLHMVKCSIYSTVRGHPVIMGPKWDQRCLS